MLPTPQCRRRPTLLCPPARQAAWSLELPPLLAMGAQLAGTVVAARGNSATCASPYLHRAANRRLMARAYALLQPAVAPLEPLLATVGLQASHPSRQCLCGEQPRSAGAGGSSTGGRTTAQPCPPLRTRARAPHPMQPQPPPPACPAVLAVLQAWGAFFLPLLLTTRSQLRAYLEWRRRGRNQQRAQRHRRPAAPSQLRGAGPAGPGAAGSPASGSGSGSGGAASNKSSPLSPTSGGSGASGPWFGRGSHPGSNGSGGTSTPRSSLSSDSIDEAAGLFSTPPMPSLAQLLKPARRGGKPHPEDWQARTALPWVAGQPQRWCSQPLKGCGYACGERALVAAGGGARLGRLWPGTLCCRAGASPHAGSPRVLTRVCLRLCRARLQYEAAANLMADLSPSWLQLLVAAVGLGQVRLRLRLRMGLRLGPLGSNMCAPSAGWGG